MFLIFIYLFYCYSNLYKVKILNFFSISNKDLFTVFTESRYLYDFYAKSHDVRKFVIHEDYNKAAKFACDIALIFLADKIQFSSKAKKGVIVSHNKWMKENEKFIATGWGLTSVNKNVLFFK